MQLQQVISNKNLENTFSHVITVSKYMQKLPKLNFIHKNTTNQSHQQLLWLALTHLNYYSLCAYVRVCGETHRIF